MFGGLLAEFAGVDGFLRLVGVPTRASLMLDVVFVAMFAVVPALAVSVQLAKRGKFAAHRLVQLALGIVLLVAVIAFEVDMRVSGWRHRAVDSPHFRTLGEGGPMAWSCPVGLSLIVHLAFAIPTAILWAWVIYAALKGFANPPTPGPHSHSHKKLGWLAAGGMVGTAVTGWIFYYLAFVAS